MPLESIFSLDVPQLAVPLGAVVEQILVVAVQLVPRHDVLDADHAGDQAEAGMEYLGELAVGREGMIHLQDVELSQTVQLVHQLKHCTEAGF